MTRNHTGVAVSPLASASMEKSPVRVTPQGATRHLSENERRNACRSRSNSFLKIGANPRRVGGDWVYLPEQLELDGSPIRTDTDIEARATRCCGAA